MPSIAERIFGRRGERRALTPLQMWGADYWPDSRNPSGERVTQSNASTLATVFACQTLISDMVSSLPVDVYRKVDGVPVQVPHESRRYPSWLELPVPNDPTVSIATHFSQVAMSLISDGNAFTHVMPHVDDPSVLTVLDPTAVTIKRDGGLRPIYLVRRGNRLEQFTSDNILHIARTMRPGGDRGMSPIDEAAITLGTYMAATKHAGRFYKNGALLSTVLEVPGELSEADAKALRDAFEEGHTGDNVFRTGILSGGAKATTLGVTPEQAQFLETLKHGTVEVCRMFRVPPMLVGVNEPGAVSYASAVEAVKAFARNTLAPFLRPIELAYSRLITDPSVYLRFDMNGLLRADPEARYAAYATAVEKGWLSRNEIRAWEELAPMPGKGGDLYTVQAQMTDLEQIANPPPEPPPPPPAPEVEPPTNPSPPGEPRHYAGKHDQKSHGKGRTSGIGTKDDPIRTKDVVVAQKALAEGKYVELRSEREVGTLLTALHDDVKAAEAAGNRPPDYDLCRVSVPKTNLFCSQAVGIPRAQMPQLKGRPIPGSPADSLPKNAKGEVDLSAGFTKHLVGKGIGVTDSSVDAKYLKASQTELNGVKVVGMARAMREGKIPAESIFVTRDDYIVDGHHRWAATIGNEYITGKPLVMGVRIIDADILDVLGEANAYAAAQGIPQAAVRSLEDCLPCQEARHLAGQHDQKAHGKGHGYGFLAGAATDPEGGFSVSAHGKVPRSGYMVSPYKQYERIMPAKSLTPDDLRSYRKEHADVLRKPNHYLGAWREGDNVYVDISVRAPDLATAGRIARAAGQEAVFDLNSFGTVYTKDIP